MQPTSNIDILLADLAGVTVVLAAATQVTIAMAQGDDVVLDGDLCPGALVAVRAGGREGWATVEAVG